MNEHENLGPAAWRRKGTAAIRVLVVGAVLVGTALTARLLWNTSGETTPEAGAEEPAGAQTYFCPMHPSYTSDRPGDCPICNMRLVPLKPGSQPTSSNVEGHAVITIDDGRRQLIGVRSGQVERKAVEKRVRAVGRVEAAETRLSTVNLKVGGWIEELFVRSTGTDVHKGDPLFALYSPELIEAQRYFVLALNGSATSGADVQPALRAARERLLLLDQSEEQIRELEATREVPHTTTFLAPSEGVVMRRNVVQGTRVEAGVDLYELADLSEVWVYADVYEYELPLVHAGMKAWIQLASQPGEPLTGTVDFVYPDLEESTRTARVRIALSNAEHRLKPGMYATVFLSADLGEQLVIDDQAVLYTGTRQLVFVDLGEGRFEPREVQTGEHVGGEVVVLDGLSVGERVVVSGNFLVDSESRLKSALTHGAQESASGHEGHRQ